MNAFQIVYSSKLLVLGPTILCEESEIGSSLCQDSQSGYNLHRLLLDTASQRVSMILHGTAAQQDGAGEKEYEEKHSEPRYHLYV
jgi:hypothetical protein